MNTFYNPFRPYVSPNNTGMTREQLRTLARQNGVKRGRNTADTVANLKAAKII